LAPSVIPIGVILGAARSSVPSRIRKFNGNFAIYRQWHLPEIIEKAVSFRRQCDSRREKDWFVAASPDCHSFADKFIPTRGGSRATSTANFKSKDTAFLTESVRTRHAREPRDFASGPAVGRLAGSIPCVESSDNRVVRQLPM